jgi:magnesium transporter
MNTIFVHRDGRTEPVSSIDRSWLGPASGVYVWVDLAAPSIPESLVLSDTFAFHPLAVDDALARKPTPKIETYDGYLFASFVGGDTDTAFFIGGHYLVSVHRGESKSVADLMDSLRHGGKAFADGPVALWHWLVDASVTALAPVVERLTACVDGFEKRAVEKANADLIGEIL